MRKICCIVLIYVLFLSSIAFAKDDLEESKLFFQESLGKVNKIIYEFEEKVRKQPLREILTIRKMPVSMPPISNDLTIEEYLNEKTEDDEYSSEIKKWVLDEYKKLYDEIYPVIVNIGKEMKKSPLRLDTISIEMHPFGIGTTITIQINYDSKIFK